MDDFKDIFIGVILAVSVILGFVFILYLSVVGVTYIGCKSLGVDKPVACAIFGIKNINIQQKDLYNNHDN